jgi:hypothetical protein
VPEPTSTTESSFWETPRTDHAIRATASAARTDTPLLLAADCDNPSVPHDPGIVLPFAYAWAMDGDRSERLAEQVSGRR